jgi:hypothetical protein
VTSPGAQCAFTGQSSPPTGCSNIQIIPQIAPVDVSSGSALAASTYSIQPWTFNNGIWTASPAPVKCGAAPTTCTLAAVNPGTQMILQLCANQTPSCTSADYGQQKTMTACPFPSVSTPTNQPCSLGLGPGAGFVPWAPGNPSTAPTVQISMPVTLYAGTAQTSNTPVLNTYTWLNGTSRTAADLCSVSGTAGCALPKATLLGRFPINFQFAQGQAGTNPASPASIGYQTFIDPHFIGGSYVANRGLMQNVLSIEVKATTNNDMCTITSASFPGTLTKLANSNSATDIFYIWTLPDSALTRITDTNGLPQTIAGILYTGTFTATVNFDCNAVYNGSGDVVTITPIVYSYYSLAYLQSYNGAATNPEKQAESQSAVITIKT